MSNFQNLCKLGEINAICDYVSKHEIDQELYNTTFLNLVQNQYYNVLNFLMPYITTSVCHQAVELALQLDQVDIMILLWNAHPDLLPDIVDKACIYCCQNCWLWLSMMGVVDVLTASIPALSNSRADDVLPQKLVLSDRQIQDRMLQAVKLDDLESVQAIIQRYKVSDQIISDAISEACRGSMHVLRGLVKMGFRPNITLATSFAIHHHQIVILEYLLEIGVYSKVDMDAMLNYAVGMGSLAVVMMLHAKGAKMTSETLAQTISHIGVLTYIGQNIRLVPTVDIDKCNISKALKIAILDWRYQAVQYLWRYGQGWPNRTYWISLAALWSNLCVLVVMTSDCQYFNADEVWSELQKTHHKYHDQTAKQAYLQHLCQKQKNITKLTHQAARQHRRHDLTKPDIATVPEKVTKILSQDWFYTFKKWKNGMQKHTVDSHGCD